MPTLGRPPLPPEQRRSETLRQRVTPAERELIEAAGNSDWQREVLIRAAKRKR